MKYAVRLMGILFLCASIMLPHSLAYAASSKLKTGAEDVLKMVAAQALFAKIAPLIGLGPKKTEEEKKQQKEAKQEKKEKKEKEKEEEKKAKAEKGAGKESGVETEGVIPHIDLVHDWAVKGDVQAQCILAYAYETGQRVPQSRELAIIWENRAADQNLHLVKNFIPPEYGKKKPVPLERLFSIAGRRSHVGKYVERNVDDAVRWSALGAAEKDAMSVSYLASAYYTGRGITQNYENAVFCAKLTKKDPLSIKVLMEAYKDGNGVEQDLEKSKYYAEYLDLVVQKKLDKKKAKLLKKYNKEIEAGELYGIVR